MKSTFKNLIFAKIGEDAFNARITFSNGWGLSVIKGRYFGLPKDRYQTQIIDVDGTALNDPDLVTMFEPKTEDQVTKLMLEIQEF